MSYRTYGLPLERRWALKRMKLKTRIHNLQSELDGARIRHDTLLMKISNLQKENALLRVELHDLGAGEQRVTDMQMYDLSQRQAHAYAESQRKRESTPDPAVSQASS